MLQFMIQFAIQFIENTSVFCMTHPTTGIKKFFCFQYQHISFQYTLIARNIESHYYSCNVLYLQNGFCEKKNDSSDTNWQSIRFLSSFYYRICQFYVVIWSFIRRRIQIIHLNSCFSSYGIGLEYPKIKMNGL